MAVTASRPPDTSLDVLDDKWATPQTRIALLEHAREVRQAARATVAHSRALKVVLEEWRSEALTRRCACARCNGYVIVERPPNSDEVRVP
jgi:hypothetical protein